MEEKCLQIGKLFQSPNNQWTIGGKDCSSALCSCRTGKPSVPGLGSERGLGDELKSSLLTLQTKPGQRAEVKPTGTRPSNQAHAVSS